MTPAPTADVVHLPNPVVPRAWHRPVIRILVGMAADAGDAVAEALDDLARFHVVACVSSPADVQREMARLRPDVLLVDAVLDEEPMVPWVRSMLKTSPATKVVLCADDMRTALRDEAGAAGVRAIVGHGDPFDRVLRTVDNLVPHLAAERPPDDTTEGFEGRMRSLLLEQEPTLPSTAQWWRQRGVRPWLIGALIALLPVLAMATWVAAALLGFTR